VPRSHPVTNSTRFTLGVVGLAWIAAYVVAVPVQSLIVGLAGHGGEPSDTWPTSITALSALSLWVCFIVSAFVLSRRYGSGRFAEDFRLAFQWRDLIGAPIGIACQLILVPALYWPLQRMWSDAFRSDELSERARNLWDRADGAWLVVLIVVVVIGAPVVEEIIYRGMIQQALHSRVDDALAVFLAAIFFALIHLQPVEIPGLFAFGLVVGVCFMRTGRLGMSIMVHVGFNATGLLLVS
jgi:membrane protease YdiL (CAAX protease family)